ncbi:hypothetical protein [Streptomyces sp. NPDC048663]|uniref:hypothetical protein n=1 Tax=Streptomyces sp. NPDC048663 TaxID=3155638 RepID=UPI00342C6B9A
MFSGTIVYCGRQHHPEHGLIHVLGYQNSAANLADGPNAMLLHLPTRQLTPRPGGAPELDAPVAVDHWVLLSTDQAPADWGAAVAYPGDMRHHLRAFLPATVVGRYFGSGQALPNGDFAISHRDLLSGVLDRIERLRPAPW